MIDRCPACGRLDAKAGATHGCHKCEDRLDRKESRWWDINFCELCIDPPDHPHIDEGGTKRWRACSNLATRQVIQHGKKNHILNVCEEHFKKEAS